jgi:hypothetical protein
MAKNDLRIDKNFGAINWVENSPSKTSLLGDVILEFSNVASELEFEDSDIALPFKIEEKISYNAVAKYTYLFENFISNEALLRRIYVVVHETKPLARAMILRLVKHEYRKCKGQLLKGLEGQFESEIACVRQHSDFLIESVLNTVSVMLVGVSSVENVEQEYINECVGIVVADAFFECKILENPNT